MRRAERHTFQVLTKRPKRMRALLSKAAPSPAPNVWLGTSIESADYVSRADELRQTPAAVRFISAEPLLGNLDPRTPDDEAEGTGGLSLREIDWLIVGGESGPSHRPVQSAWVRNLRDAATLSNTAFFFKQWGGRTPKAGGRELDGRTWDEMPAPTTKGESDRG
jgi:protein gp37